MQGTNAVLFFTFLLVDGLLLFAVVKLYQKTYALRIENNSVVYRQIVELNTGYTFREDLRWAYEKEEILNSRREFMEFQFDKYLKVQMLSRQKWFFNLHTKIQYNRAQYADYVTHYEAVLSQDTYTDKRLSFAQRWFNRAEKKYCAQMKLHPITDTSITVHISYTSPQGRNHYAASESYNADELFELLQETQGKEQRKALWKEQARMERLKMTERMRVQVFKRDGYRCQMCGAAPSDANDVTLHVDHIYPIAKGGKTTMDNLQTLCSRCNWGKGTQLM